MFTQWTGCREEAGRERRGSGGRRSKEGREGGRKSGERREGENSLGAIMADCIREATTEDVMGQWTCLKSKY